MPPRSAATHVFIRASAAAQALAVVDAGLDEYNRRAGPALADVRALHVMAHSAAAPLRVEAVVGGAVGRSWGLCCELQQLWVQPELRLQGIGGRLMDAFEAEAQERGCQMVYLETFSFQAPSFYLARGYEVALRTEGFTGGVVKFTLQKSRFA